MHHYRHKENRPMFTQQGEMFENMGKKGGGGGGGGGLHSLDESKGNRRTWGGIAQWLERQIHD